MRRVGPRIDVNQDWEVHDWAHKLGVSEEESRAAVKAVGDKAVDVERHLRGKKRTV